MPFDPADLQRLRDVATSQRVASLLGVELNGDGTGCCPFHKDSRPSFKAYAGGGWKCFAGCGGGPDGLSLWMAKTGDRFAEAAGGLAARLGVTLRSHGAPGVGGSHSTQSTPTPGSVGLWEASLPPPADLSHPDLGPPDRLHVVRDAAGRVFGAHARWYRTSDAKEVRWWRNGRWSLGGLKVNQAPLYGAEYLSAYDRSALLFVVEGETACDSLHSLGLAAVATVCGAGSLPGSAVLADLEAWCGPLVLWADTDAIGKRHMQGLAGALAGKVCDVRIFQPAEDGPEGADAVDWIEARRDRPAAELRSELMTAASRDMVSVGEVQADPFPVYELEAFLRLEIPPRRWLAEGLIAERGLAMVHAKRGVGKTFFVLGLAYALAAGKTFLRYQVPGPAGVLVVDGEMPTPDLQDRLRLYLGTDSMPEAPLRLLCADLAESSLPSLATTEGQAVIERKLTPSIKLLVLDSVSTLCRTGEASENDAASWDAVQAWILRLRRRGYAVLIVHHAGKDGKQRGTSKREDVLDQVVHLRHPGDYHPSEGARFEVHLEKGRQVRGEMAEPYEAMLTSAADGGTAWTWKPLRAVEGWNEIRDLVVGGETVRRIADQLELSTSMVHRTIRRMRESGELPEEAGRRRKAL